MITNYIPNTCKYSVNNLKKVVHIFSSASNKVYIDNGEAYVTSGITDFQTISATSVTFEENTSYDDRFKFQKTVTVTCDGFLKVDFLNEKYYVVLEDENKVKWLVNVDFPSLVTYTYALADGTDETVFTFNALSNFPSLKLNSNINNYIQCKQYNHTKVNELKMLEKKYANINASSSIIYGYSNQVYKTVKPNEGSIKLEETFDGTNVTTNIQFNINFDEYQSSWHYNLLEYPNNKYVAVIDHVASGFEMGLVPSYIIQGSHQIGASDVVTITLVGTSQRGSEWANSWTEVAIAPVYKWKLTDEWACYSPPPFDEKFKLTLNDSSTVSAECDATSAITSGEISTPYSSTLVSAEIGNCITSIDAYAFYACSGLTNVTIGNAVTSIGSAAFAGCASLTSVTIPDSIITINDSAFFGCSGLTGIEIPNSVTSIGLFTFAGCSGLTNVVIGSGITNIGYYAFGQSNSLTSITVNATTPPSLGEKVFYQCNSLANIYVPSASVDTYKAASGWSEYADRIQAIP